ncbi:MAG: hypothetical protein LBV80_10925 [Deltaproteobacteria bacterium]|jgi:hypothetical protein|nr:hypothetical protein [Deltaproteobacteria bacterium]
MKEILKIVAMLILFFCVIFTPNICVTAEEHTESEYDVRKTRWGMSIEEIKKSESGPMFGKPAFSPLLKITELNYRDKIFGVWCDILYEHTPERGLYTATYIFLPQSRDDADRLFENITAILSKKYKNYNDSLKKYSSREHQFTNDRTFISLKYAYASSKKIIIYYDEKKYWEHVQEVNRKIGSGELNFKKQKTKAEPSDTSQF